MLLGGVLSNLPFHPSPLPLVWFKHQSAIIVKKQRNQFHAACVNPTYNPKLKRMDEQETSRIIRHLVLEALVLSVTNSPMGFLLADGFL